MRWFICLIFFSTPLKAWEFTPGLPCTLSHETSGASLLLTYDPRLPLYSMTVTRSEPWPDAPVFTLQYDGPFGQTLTTDRHYLSDDKRSLTVEDRGFGNVIAGLLSDRAFTVRAGAASLNVSLAVAAGPTSDFAACKAMTGA